MLCCAQPCQCILSPPAANPHRAGASHQIDTHLRSADTGDDSRLLPNAPVFLRLLCEIELCYGLVPHFANLICQKCRAFAEKQIFDQNWALATVWCTFLSTSSPAPTETETLLRQPQEPVPEKTRFAPESVFTPEFTRFRAVTLPNYLMMGDWHDDVLDTMAWMLTMTIVNNSEVF